MGNFYYIKSAGQEKGPFTMDQLRSMWDRGVITGDTHFRRAESDAWTALAEAFSAGSRPAASEASNLRTISSILRVLVLLAIGAALFLGNYHIITGGGTGPRVVRRESFGFSEVFINVDAITSMPWIAAVTRFPLGVRVLQREGLIESEEERHRRIDEETERRLEQLRHER